MTDSNRRRVTASWLLGLVALSVGAPARAADPTTADCLAANASAAHLRNEHKLRDARSALLLCAARSCPDDIQVECAHRVVEVNAAIPTVVFDAKDGAGNDLTAVKVTMDGAPLVDALQGTAISLDPGEHAFRFEVAGQAPVDRVFVVLEGVKERHETIVIGNPSPLPALAPVLAPATPTPTRPADESPAGGSGLKTAGLIVAGVGLAGVVVGSIFGADSFSKWSSAQSDCQSATSCANHAQALSDRDSAYTAATISTVSFIAGGAAVAAGAVLYLVPWRRGAKAGPEVGIAPSVRRDGAGMLVEGVF